MPPDLLRSAFYKFADVRIRTLSRSDVYQLRLVQRTGRRRFLHANEIVEMINRKFRNSVSAAIFYTNCSLADQIHIFADADLIMTPHGAGQTNILFMRPHTVLMEAFAPYFYKCSFMNLANIIRIHYMSITTYNETYLSPKARPGAGERYYQLGLMEYKRKHFITSLIDPNPFNIYAIVDDAVEFLNSYRYRRRVYYDNFIFWNVCNTHLVGYTTLPSFLFSLSICVLSLLAGVLPLLAGVLSLLTHASFPLICVLSLLICVCSSLIYAYSSSICPYLLLISPPPCYRTLILSCPSHRSASRHSCRTTEPRASTHLHYEAPLSIPVKLCIKLRNNAYEDGSQDLPVWTPNPGKT